jgi:hypothetical protein
MQSRSSGTADLCKRLNENSKNTGDVVLAAFLATATAEHGKDGGRADFNRFLESRSKPPSLRRIMAMADMYLNNYSHLETPCTTRAI